MFSARTRQILYIALGPVLCFIIANLPAPAGMEQKGMLNMGACAWILFWWLTEVFPMSVTSIIAIPLFGLLGVLPALKGFAFFGSNSVMLIFGATIIIGALKESNFIIRYAYLVLNARFIQGKPARLFLLFSISAGLLSCIAPNIPLIIIFAYLLVSLARNASVPPDNRLMRGLVVLNSSASSIGGIGTPLGGVPNLVVMGMISKMVGHEVTFWEWTLLGFPVALPTLIIIGLLAAFYFKPTGKSDLMKTEYIRNKLTEMGPMSRYEKIAMSSILLALFLWAFGPNLCGLLGWETGKKLLNGPYVAIAIGALLFITPLKTNPENGKIEFAMTWKKAVNNIGWEILVLAMGILAFGDVLLAGGIDKWLASVFRSVLGDISGEWVIFALILFCSLGSQFCSNLALISLTVPMTVSLASIYHFNAVAVCIAVGMVSNVAIMFPVSGIAAGAAIAGAKEYGHIRDFAGFGLIACLLLSFMIFGMTVLFGDMIIGY